MRLRASILAGMSIVTLASGSSAQTGVGRIERVAEVIGGGEPVQVRGTTDRVQLMRRATGSWILVGPRSELLESDRLRVRRYVDVRLRVERPRQRGRLVFLPELLGPNGGRIFEVGEIGQQADYMLGDTMSPGELTVVVESGALVVNWSVGRLAVVAAGVRTIIAGTRVAFVMDSTGNNGVMFLEEGSVSFPDFPGTSVSPGDVVQLTRGLPPAVSTPAAAQANAARSAMRYNGEQIWASFRPFWAKPAFLIPAVATVVTATTLAATQRSDGDGPRRGTVIVRIPFR